MLGSSAIIAFVATTDPARARTFYRDVLGLKLVADEPFALVFAAGGTTLRVSKVQELSPAPFTVLGWNVRDITAAIGELTGRGVTFEHFEGIRQDESGICTFPGGAKVAWFKDPDRNLLSLTQFP
jgi:catechol 2,3-dioxygenase-like lactoylglutathione lyase family enzyme